MRRGAPASLNILADGADVRHSGLMSAVVGGAGGGVGFGCCARQLARLVGVEGVRLTVEEEPGACRSGASASFFGQRCCGAPVSSC